MRQVDINGRFLTQATTGVQRVAEQVVQALDRELASRPALRNRYSFRLVAPRGHRPFSLRHVELVTVGRLRGQAWEQLELPGYSRGRLLLHLCNTAPITARSIVMIHDASVFAVPEAYSRAFRTWYRMLIPLLGQRALRVLTNSRFSQDELSRWARIPAAKIARLPLGADHLLQTPANTGVLRRLSVQPGRYILGVGSQSPHKNMGTLVSAVSRLGANRLPLVLAGATDSRVFAATGSDGALNAGYVTDGELRALYENATCFVYPSLYEGFGLPPLEAMCCGCPVIVANAASLPEVCGDGALFCNPQDPEEIAARLRTVIEEPAQRERLRRSGADRARTFTWKRAAETLVTVLDEVTTA